MVWIELEGGIERLEAEVEVEVEVEWEGLSVPVCTSMPRSLQSRKSRSRQRDISRDTNTIDALTLLLTASEGVKA